MKRRSFPLSLLGFLWLCVWVIYRTCCQCEKDVATHTHTRPVKEKRGFDWTGKVACPGVVGRGLCNCYSGPKMTGEGQDRVNDENLKGATRDGHFPSDCFLSSAPTAGWRARILRGLFFLISASSCVKGLFFSSLAAVSRRVSSVSLSCYPSNVPRHLHNRNPLSHPLHHLSSLIAIRPVTHFFLRRSQSQVWEPFRLCSTADDDVLIITKIQFFQVDLWAESSIRVWFQI